LEEEDEIILDQIDKLKYKSSTRSRRKESTVVPVADNVKTFVEARQEWIAKEEKVSSPFLDACNEKPRFSSGIICTAYREDGKGL